MPKTKKDKYTVAYEVYNVKERYEENGIDTTNTPSDWFEYEMDLYKNGKLIESWDSLSDTYDGIHKLTRESATKAAEDIVKDPNGYFNALP